MLYIVFLFFISMAGEAAIYHHDDRQSLVDHSNPAFRQKAESIGAIVKHSSLTHVNSVSKPHWKLHLEKYSSYQRSIEEPLCETERFRNENVVKGTAATGFLVGPPLMVTAGHVIEDQAECDERSVVFGFDTSDKSHFSEQEVYRCQRVIVSVNEGQRDYAVFELDRPVSQRKPLVVGDVDWEKPDKVWMMGHPMGLSKKVTDKGSVLEDVHPFYFTALLDTYVGNSGSPVFSYATGKVLGILIEGEPTDITIRGEWPTGCWYSKVYCQSNMLDKFSCDDTRLTGAKVSRASLWKPFLSH